MSGAVLDTVSMDSWRVLLCALAGPAGSFLLLLFARYIPRIAFCGLIQGCFNLMPVAPLDGGRAVRCLSEMMFSKDTAQCICTAAEYASAALILLLGAYGTFQLQLGMVPVFLSSIFLYRMLHGKISCKEGKLLVQ